MRPLGFTFDWGERQAQVVGKLHMLEIPVSILTFEDECCSVGGTKK
jgi:hypothetical protein